jgi:hypothetical protein
MNFSAVLDENLSFRLAGAMSALGEQLQHMTDRFSKGTPDTEWIPVLGDENLVVIGSDARILRRPSEAALVKQHGLHVAVFPAGLSRCDQARVLVLVWPKLKLRFRKAKKNRPIRVRITSRGGIVDLK